MKFHTLVVLALIALLVFLIYTYVTQGPGPMLGGA